MGAYTSAYTATYPASAGLVEAGYTVVATVGVIAGAVGGAGLGRLMSSLTSGQEDDEQMFWGQFSLVEEPATFAKISGTWEAVTSIPTTYDKVVGGGRSGDATKTDLDELLAANLITTDQYNASIATV